MKRNLKRCLAFLLAVVLVSTTCIYHSADSFLQAEEEEQAEELILTEEVDIGEDLQDPESGEEGENISEVISENEEISVIQAEVQPAEQPLEQPAEAVTQIADQPTEEEIQDEFLVLQEADPAVSGEGEPLPVEEVLEEEIDEKATYTVAFYYTDPNTGEEHELTSQRIMEGERVELPSNVPDFDDYEFTGWWYDGTRITSETTAEGDMTVTAKYAPIGKCIVTINYLYKDGNTVAAPAYRAEILKGTSFKETILSPIIGGFTADREAVTIQLDEVTEDITEEVFYTGGEVGYTVIHRFEGLPGESYRDVSEAREGQSGTETQAEARTEEGFTAGEVSNYTLSGNENPDIVIEYKRNHYTLEFNTDGGDSYIAPVSYLYGQTIKYPDPADMTKTGYEFSGWDQEPATMPAGDTTITAQWNAATKASYKVVYWQEKVPGTYTGDDKWDYKEQEVIYNAQVGNEATYKSRSYNGFELNKSETDKVKPVVAADGSTVKNVYFDRKVYTIEFYERTWDGWKENTSLTIKAKYGEDISKQWEKACENSSWGPDKSGNTQYTLFASMPAENLTMYQKGSSVNGKKIIYYVEGLDGNKVTYAEFKVGYLASLTEEDQQPIEGFTYSSWKQSGSSPLWLYYTRNSYKLEFQDCQYKNGNTISNVTVKYEDSIYSQLPSYDGVQPQKGSNSDYKCVGWYYSPACEPGTEVKPDDKMPAHNVQIFPKWEIPVYTVTLYSFNEEGKEQYGDPITVTKGETISSQLPSDLEREDYVFTGWYTDEACTTPFVASTRITNDLSLYAGWQRNNGTYTYIIRCVDEEGNLIDTDERKGSGAVNSVVTVKAPEIDGYYAPVTSQSVKLTQEGQVITFRYRQAVMWEYTVRYVDEKGVDISPYVRKSTANSSVVEKYKVIKDYNLTSPTQVWLGKESENREIIFTYKKQDQISVTVKHLLEQTDGSYKTEATDSVQKYAGATFTAEPKTYEGYDSPEAQSILVRKEHGDYTIELRYTRQSRAYTVYYVDKDDNKELAKVEDKAKLDTIFTLDSLKALKQIDGYKYDSATKDVLQIAADVNGNVITLYYVKRNDLSYTFRYIARDGSAENVLHETTVGNQLFGTKITVKEEDKLSFDGYEFVEKDKDELILKTEENIIKFYYAKRTDLEYTVNFLDKKTEEKIKDSVVVENQTFDTEIFGRDEAKKVQIEGYNFALSDPESLKIQTDKKQNVLNLYYEKQKGLKYYVNYLDKDTGESIASQKEAGDQIFNSQIMSVNEKIDIDGYDFERADKESLRISTKADENVINLYYTKRTDLSYTVNYLEKDTNKILTKAKEVGNQTFKQEIKAKDEIIEIDGYVFDSAEKESITISTADENVINLYYTKRTDLSYTVNYLDTETETQIRESKTQGNQTFGDVIDSASEVVDIDGYVFEGSATVEELTIGTGENVLNLYYTKRTDLSYKVYYFNEDGSELLETGAENPKTVNNRTFREEISSEKEVINIEGYEFVGWNAEKLTIKTDNTQNEIKLYYARRADLAYTVTYHYRDDKDESVSPDTIVSNQEAVFEARIPYDVDGYKERDGKNYILDGRKGTGGVSFGASQGTVSATESENTVDIYYVQDSNGPEGKPDDVPDYKQYRVTYAGNGGTGEVTDPYIYEAGYMFKALANSFSKDGTEYVYWKTMDGADRNLEPGDEYEMPEGGITLNAQWKGFTVSKSYTPSSNAEGHFKLGDVIEFPITVTNIGDIDLTDIVVSDSLDGAAFGPNNDEIKTITIPSLEAGTNQTVNAYFKVTEAEIGNPDFTNTATAEADGMEKSGTTDSIPLAGVDKQLSLTKRITNTGTGENGKFTTNDQAEFEIVVKNTGNQTLKDIVVEDALEGAEIVKDGLLERILGGYTVKDGVATIGSLKPGESIILKAVYVIRESDLGNPDFRNVATASVPDEVPPTPGTSDPVPVEDKAPEFEVTKQIVNEQSEYKVGETINYVITVRNIGNMKLENVIVTDNMTNSVGGVTFEENENLTIEGNSVTITELGIGDVVEVNCSYTVTRGDAGAAIRNAVIVNGSTTEDADPDPEEKGDRTEPADVEKIYNVVIHYVYEDGSMAAPDVTAQYLAGETFIYTSPVLEGYTPDLLFLRTEEAGMPSQDVEWTVTYREVREPEPPVVEPTPTPTPPTGGEPTPGPTEEDPTPAVPDDGTDPEPAPPITVPEFVVLPEEEIPLAEPATVVPVNRAPVGALPPADDAEEELIEIEEEDVPLGGMITEDEDGNLTVIPIEDEEVPLSKREMNEHKCCALSFILMLASMLIYTWYTNSMKRHQKKLAGLKDQLAEERLKRDLGISGTRGSRR